MTMKPAFAEIDLSQLGFWERPLDERMAAFEVLRFLVVAGNETVRTSLSHALKLFTDFPERRRLLLKDFDARIAGAVEEIVRFSTPIIFQRRNVTQDYSLNGHAYHAGDKVLLFYASANRDETVFKDPDVFDITRAPNRHVGFGGPGPALLPRRQPGPPGDRHLAQGALYPHTGHSRRGRARPDGVRAQQWIQTSPLHIHPLNADERCPENPERHVNG
jgi:hypothetical protein